jgi:hypothetical protein
MSREWVSLARDMGDQRNVERLRPRTWRAIAGEQRGVSEEDERQWPVWCMLAGVFAMIIAFWWVSFSVLVTYWTVGRLFCAFAFAGNLLYGQRVRSIVRMTRSYWFMFNMLAIGPALFGLFFGVNALFSGDAQYYAADRRVANMDVKRYWIEHGELPMHVLQPRHGVGSIMILEHGDAFMLRTSKGLFGFPILHVHEYP